MAKKKENTKEVAADKCYTPDYALDPLLPYLCGINRVWEPAQGDGRIVRTLTALRFQVTAGDIETDQDYFDDRNVPDEYDAQITNPPFSIKYKWLKRACELEKPFALLMPVDVFGAAAGQNMIFQYGIEIILLSPRINFFMPNKGWSGKGSMFSVAWFTRGLHIGSQLVQGKIVPRRQFDELPAVPEGQLVMF